jgi:hypothetical protein
MGCRSQACQSSEATVLEREFKRKKNSRLALFHRFILKPCERIRNQLAWTGQGREVYHLLVGPIAQRLEQPRKGSGLVHGSNPIASRNGLGVHFAWVFGETLHRVDHRPGKTFSATPEWTYSLNAALGRIS